jgi:hypothetical protein
MKLRLGFFFTTIGVAIMAVASANAADIALNAPVTIVSGASLLCCGSAPLSVVMDGVFLPEGTPFHSPAAYAGAVEWSSQYSGDPSVASGLVLDINLGAEYTITGAIVQADNNDSYMLQYWDSASGTWQLLYNVPAIGGSGLETRPNADQQTYAPVGPVVTDMLQFSAYNGDAGDAVSEIEVEGSLASTGTIPEPCSLLLLSSGMAGVGLLGLVRRKSGLRNRGIR